MTAVAVQVTVNAPVDWPAVVAAVGTILLALGTGYLALKTRASVQVAGEVANAAKAEADATVKLVNEAVRDRELAVQPVIVLEAEQSGGDGVRPAIQLRNIGRGPAIRARVFLWSDGALIWNTGPGLSLAAGDTCPPQLSGAAPRYEYLEGEQREAAVDSDIPGSGSSDQDLLAICLDQLGNALCFNLRTGDPPEVSRRGPVRPAWATAAFNRYSSRQPKPPDAPMVAWV